LPKVLTVQARRHRETAQPRTSAVADVRDLSKCRSQVNLRSVAIQKLAAGLQLLDWFGAEAPHNDGKQSKTYGGWYCVYPG
jgi:hypothetical protein